MCQWNISRCDGFYIDYRIDRYAAKGYSEGSITPCEAVVKLLHLQTTGGTWYNRVGHSIHVSTIRLLEYFKYRKFSLVRGGNQTRNPGIGCPVFYH